jgi:orotidine-5'-phosphate decarboxylase
VLPQTCRLKIGKELHTRYGLTLVELGISAGFDVFLDLKFHDIPNTVAAAAEAAADIGVWMINLHVCGGRVMMETTMERLANRSSRPLITGVTVLTSMDKQDLHEVGVAKSPAEQVPHLAWLAHDCGLDGVVCSPLEAETLREERGADFVLVTPGIRDAKEGDDQKRVATIENAISWGSHYQVIGRPIVQDSDPLNAALKLHDRAVEARNSL